MFLYAQSSDSSFCLESIERMSGSRWTFGHGPFAPEGSRYVYEGAVGGAWVRAEFDDLGASTFAFAVEADGVDLADTSNPAAIALTIGDGHGKTTERLEGCLHLDNRLGVSDG